jgi:hypothetical protein
MSSGQFQIPPCDVGHMATNYLKYLPNVLIPRKRKGERSNYILHLVSCRVRWCLCLGFYGKNWYLILAGHLLDSNTVI